MKTVICAIAVSFSTLASAQEAKDESHIFLTVPVGSYHFNRDKDWREWNPGLGFEYAPNENWSVILGSYLNSNDKRTNYVGAAFYRLRYGNLALGVDVAVATGYRSPVLVYPAVTYQKDRYGVSMIFIPTSVKGFNPFVGLQLRLQLK